MVKSIPDGQAATVTLTNAAGERRLFDCVFKESIAPSFFLVFPPENLPETLDQSKQCPFVSRDRSDAAVSFLAAIIERSKSHVLELVAKKSVRPEDLREYFRVDIRTDVMVRYYSNNPDDRKIEWEMDGQTVDLSQSGVMTILPDECRNEDPIEIEILLFNPAQTVICKGHVVRSKRVRKGRWLTSFHFDAISAHNRDAIAMNCFAEQRRQLRENVQTSG